MEKVELCIVGGGPAGTSAGVYAGRKKLKTAYVTDTFGGQSVVSPEIYNWIGTPVISGDGLAEAFKKHVKEYEGDDFMIFQNKAESIRKEDDGFVISLDNKKEIHAEALLIATGSTRRKLDVKGAEQFDQKGLTYCASCDGPLFSGQDVVVVGGGNAGFETAAQLLAYTKSVTLLHRSGEYRADKITVDKVLSHPNMTGILNVTTKEIKGDKFVDGIVYEVDGKEVELPVTGVFVEIGLIPETHLVKDLVDTDKIGRVIVDPKTQKTSHPRIWAAGDCTDVLYHQNNISAGDAVKALENLYLALRA